MAADNQKNCSLVQSIIDYSLKSHKATDIKFLTPNNDSRSVDLYVKFKIEHESTIDEIVNDVKFKTHGNLDDILSFIQD